MTHTHDTLMALVSDYVSEYPNDTCGAAQKAALQSALTEVLAERDALKAELDIANEPCAWCAGNR